MRELKKFVYPSSSRTYKAQLEVSAHDVIIVGGGTSGSALASFLSERGLDVALVDRKVGVGVSNHAVALQPNGIAALGGMGFLQDVERIGQKIHETLVFDEHHRLITSADLNELDHPYPYFLFVLPSELTNLFRMRFLTKKIGRLLEGFEFDNFLEEGNVVRGVRGTVQYKSIEIRANLVVGADGPFSKVRERSGLRCRLKTYEDTYVVAVLGGSLGDLRARFVIGKGVSFGAATIRDQRVYFFCYMAKKEFEQYKKAGLDSLKRRLVSIEPDLLPVLSGSLKDWSQIGFLRPIGVFLESWTGIPALL